MSEGFIPLSVPNLKGKELEYVTEAVRSEWVSTAGSYVSDFEASIADYVGARAIVEIVHMRFAHELHNVVIARVVLREQDHMMELLLAFLL